MAAPSGQVPLSTATMSNTLKNFRGRNGPAIYPAKNFKSVYGNFLNVYGKPQRVTGNSYNTAFTTLKNKYAEIKAAKESEIARLQGSISSQEAELKRKRNEEAAAAKKRANERAELEQKIRNEKAKANAARLAAEKAKKEGIAKAQANIAALKTAKTSIFNRFKKTPEQLAIEEEQRKLKELQAPRRRFSLFGGKSTRKNRKNRRSTRRNRRNTRRN